MVRVLVAALVAMIVSLVVGPKFIEFLRRNEFGQHIREEGPAGHVVKQGTPVDGRAAHARDGHARLPRALASTPCRR